MRFSCLHFVIQLYRCEVCREQSHLNVKQMDTLGGQIGSEDRAVKMKFNPQNMMN